MIDTDVEEWDAAGIGWAAWMRSGGASEETIYLRRRYLDRFRAHSGAASPYDVTLDALVAFVGQVQWRSAETRYSARSALRSFYRYAVATGRLDCDPTERVPKVTRTPPEPRPAPESLLEEALASAIAAPCRRRYATSAAGGDDRLMVMLAAYQGLRRGEIARVHARDVDGDRLLVHGKGRRARVVPLHPVLERELARFAVPAYDGYVFPGRDGGHVSPYWVGEILSRHLGRERRGYEGRHYEFPGHTLRHRFGTAVRDASDVLAASELLGHANLEVTRIYTRVSIEHLREAVLAVGPASLM